MTPFFQPIRSAVQTTLPCPACGQLLVAERTCREAYMRCPACAGRFPMERFIASADDALEQFLDGLYIDRI